MPNSPTPTVILSNSLPTCDPLFYVDLDETVESVVEVPVTVSIEDKVRHLERKLRQQEERETALRADYKSLLESFRNISQANLQLSQSIAKRETIMHVELSKAAVINKVRMTHVDDFSRCHGHCAHVKVTHSDIIKCQSL